MNFANGPRDASIPVVHRPLLSGSMIFRAVRAVPWQINIFCLPDHAQIADMSLSEPIMIGGMRPCPDLGLHEIGHHAMGQFGDGLACVT